MAFKRNQGATEAQVKALPSAIRALLPPDYLDFMRQCNGGEGFVQDEYLVLWRVEELERFNREYEVAEYLSEALLFGTNGGGEAFGFRMSVGELDIVEVPFVGMDEESCTHVARTFSDFISGIDA